MGIDVPDPNKREDAVSEVIGVILTVALVVILAAVVGAFSFGMVGNVSKNKDIAISIRTNSTGSLLITIVGGRDVPLLTSVHVLINGADMTTVTGPFRSGQQLYGLPGSYGQANIAVVGYFADNTTQILIEKMP